MAIESSMRNSLNPCDNAVPDGGAAWAGGSDGPLFLEGVKARYDSEVAKNGPYQAYAACKVDATCFSGVQSAPEGLFL